MLPIIKFYFFYSNEESVKELPHLSYLKNTKHPNYLKVACKLLTQTIFFFFSCIFNELRTLVQSEFG